MKKLLSPLRSELRAGRRAVLCTVLGIEGSAPRAAGAKMLVRADGSTLGTVGGGALEHFAALHASELLPQGRSETRQYRLDQNGAANIGMVCGGEVLLGFLCLLPESAQTLSALDALDRALSGHENAWLQTEYRKDGTAELTVTVGEDLHGEGARLPKEPTLAVWEDSVLFTEPVSERFTVYIFGGGHVGAALVPALAAVGFPVTVFDARQELAVKERFPLADRVVCGDYGSIAETVQILPEDYVVVMTPGHGADFQVLCQALNTGASYIGCIGSRKKVAFVNARLQEAGFSDAQIARIHAPIGLPIRAQTPEEIAVSIAAELILHRHGG